MACSDDIYSVGMAVQLAPAKRPTKLTAESKRLARARALRAGRTYPNLIDNMYAAKLQNNGGGAETRKRTTKSPRKRTTPSRRKRPPTAPGGAREHPGVQVASRYRRSQ